VSNRMVGVFASINLLLHHKVQKFSSGTGSPGWSRKKGCKMVVVVVAVTVSSLFYGEELLGISGTGFNVPDALAVT